MMMYLIVFLVAGLTAAIVVAVMNKLAVMQEAELGRRTARTPEKPNATQVGMGRQACTGCDFKPGVARRHTRPKPVVQPQRTRRSRELPVELL